MARTKQNPKESVRGLATRRSSRIAEKIKSASTKTAKAKGRNKKLRRYNPRAGSLRLIPRVQLINNNASPRDTDYIPRRLEVAEYRLVNKKEKIRGETLYFFKDMLLNIRKFASQKLDALMAKVGNILEK